MRRPIPGISRSSLVSALVTVWTWGFLLVCPAWAHEHGDVHAGHDDPALALIAADEVAGRLDARSADLLRLTRVFAPETLPAAYRALADRPLRCATPLLLAYTSRLDELSPPVRQRLEQWLRPRATLAKATEYVSSGGRFRLSYETSGTHAVPSEDVAPANGVPDFVERCAQYLEESWELQFTELEFVAPDLSSGPYPVSFQSMGTYGYTTTQGAGGAGTRIVLNNDFLGFPPNDDPEGDVIGAMKVTCVHELRHASQFATSGWSEPGLWVEVDATWIEDIGYDDVNDYYNYLTSGSPISNPTLPLDAGGSGSYEDCVWQHYLSERWSVWVIQEFWNRRAANPVEDVMTSYDGAMQTVGGSVLENFVEFATWNLSTGTRAWPGEGYEEASRYPTSPYSEQASSLPVTFDSAVQRFAARFYRITGFTEGESGTVALTINRAVGSPLRARAVILTRSGTRVVEELVLDGVETRIELATRLQQVAELSVVIAHGGIGIGTQAVTLTVEEVLRPPMPVADTDTTSITVQVVAGQIANVPIALRNIGEAGSWLQYEAIEVKPVPTYEAAAAAPVAKSIAGSFLSVNLAEYKPGTSVTRSFTVANASRDFEWLAGVEITVPAGVTVMASTDFVGGTDGPLVSNGATGEATTVVWSDLNGSWGNVRNGQTASATLWLNFDLQLVGDLVFHYRIIGDGYGADPHEVTGSLTLVGPEQPVFEILAPAVHGPTLIGTTLDIEWITGFDEDVTIEFSRNGGASWESIADSTANDGSYQWLVTGPATAQGQLRMRRLGSTETATCPKTLYLVEPVSWIALQPAQVAIPSGFEAELQLVFDATGLLPGPYDAEVFFFHNGEESPLRVNVRMYVLDDSTPPNPSRDRIQIQFASPNPFNPSTSVYFELFDPGRVRVDVFDVRGRHVRRLLDRDLPTGPHAVTWDSRDDQGRFVSSGVYYYTAAIDGERHTGKVVLSK